MLTGNQINFDKGEGLVPCIVQDAQTYKVLMLAYMNKESFEKTIESKRVTFYSRSRNKLWTKGEESGNYLVLKSIELDCDADTLLCQVEPIGPTCHTGSISCWNDQKQNAFGVLNQLEKTIKSRFENEIEGSYVASLKKKGLAKIAQKVGEEGVEVVIEGLGDNRELFVYESADLLFHLLVLLRAKNVDLDEIILELQKRQ